MRENIERRRRRGRGRENLFNFGDFLDTICFLCSLVNEGCKFSVVVVREREKRKEKREKEKKEKGDLIDFKATPNGS